MDHLIDSIIQNYFPLVQDMCHRRKLILLYINHISLPMNFKDNYVNELNNIKFSTKMI